MKRQRHILIIVLVAFLGFVAIQCSTEKDAWLNRSFHNTTARYNGYFNAGELMKEAMFNYEESYQENYNKIIPIYVYADEKGSKGLYPAMDTSIKKCAVVIKKHSMPEKKEGKFAKTEWCQWIDDNWFVIGQANFHKRDYKPALEMFEFVMEQYEYEEIRFEAKLWAAKTYLENGELAEAAKYLGQLDEEVEKLEEKEMSEKDKSKKKDDDLGIKSKKNFKIKRNNGPSKGKGKGKGKKKKSGDSDEQKVPKKFPEKMSKDVHVVMADLHIRRKEWTKAIERIEKAIALKPKKKLKTRLYFILAQIHQQNGNADEAGKAYSKVIKMNPDYEMTFYAKINRALSGGGNKAELKKELLAMARDEKNLEYLDQIYYALADIELQEGNKPEGIAYLEKSAAASTDNLHQKTKTYLRLADIYFADKQYEFAQSYYDSTARVVPKDHPEYSTIKAKNKSLTTLVTHIKTVALQDSLQRLGKLSPEEQQELVVKLIEDLKAEEERKREEAIQKQIDEALNNANTAAKGGKFWIYSPQLKGAGFAEFKGKWGDRKNEDNWRRANKDVVLVDNFVGNDAEDGDSLAGDVASRYNPNTYLKNIPKNQADYDASNQKIMKALYGEGVVYKDDLKDYDQAKTSFEELLSRFPRSKLAPASLYQMFRVGNISSVVDAGSFKNKLLRDFPNSEYALMLKDPKFLEKRKKEQDKLKDEYEKYYRSYKNKDYQKIITKANQVASDTTIGEYRCKYLYLKALAIGQTNPPSINSAPFEQALNAVIKTCKGSDVAQEAQRTMDLIKNRTSVSNAGSGESSYIFSSEDAHVFLYIHDKATGSVNPAKSKISNFNGSSFSSKGLVTSTNFLNSEHQIVMVKSFKNKVEAMDYYTAFKVNTGPLKAYNKEDNFYIITIKNYSSILLEKDDAKYKAFFKKNYLD